MARGAAGVHAAGGRGAGGGGGCRSGRRGGSQTLPKQGPSRLCLGLGAAAAKVSSHAPPPLNCWLLAAARRSAACAACPPRSSLCARASRAAAPSAPYWPATWAAGERGPGACVPRACPLGQPPPLPAPALHEPSRPSAPTGTCPASACSTVDVGVPQLAMHSIREMCGTDDVGIAYCHLLAFFEVVAAQRASLPRCRCCGGHGRTWLRVRAFARAQDFDRLDKSLDVDALPPAAIRGSIDDVGCHHTHRKELIDPNPKA